MTDRDDDAWFAPTRYGYGAGLPIAPQGWALLLGYLAVVLGASYVLSNADGTGLAMLFAIIVPLTVALIIVSARKTRGGWRWRWGEED